MKLQEYLDQEKLSGLAFAEKHNLSQATISRVLNNKVTPCPETAFLIEEATKGAVTRMELLYPD